MKLRCFILVSLSFTLLSTHNCTSTAFSIAELKELNLEHLRKSTESCRFLRLRSRLQTNSNAVRLDRPTKTDRLREKDTCKPSVPFGISKASQNSRN